MTDGEPRLELPEGLTPEEERAILMALDRYFLQESPKPMPWVLQARIDVTGLGALQVRRYAHEPAQITRRPDEAPDVRKALLE